MRVLEVSRYKNNFADHQLPFVTEQGEAIRAQGCEVEYFLVKGNYITAVKALKAKIREFKPDIVHAHYGLSAITAELQNEVPVVTTFHDGETHTWSNNLMTSLMSLRAKHVIYVAQHIYDQCYFKAKHYSIIPCGVSMEQMAITPKEEARKHLNWDDNKKYIIFGGAFHDLRKNYPFLREAVEQLLGSSDWQKVQGGEQLGNIVCVEMRGLTRPECVMRMCGADLFVLPSHREGSPQALKEAMAVNCPCVATDMADARVLLGNLPGNWVLRNPLKKLDWWEADGKSHGEMVEILRDALRFDGRTNGRKRIEVLGYSNEHVAKKIIKIYENVLKDNNK